MSKEFICRPGVIDPKFLQKYDSRQVEDLLAERNDLQAQLKAQRWIPVEEGPPKDGKHILVAIEDYDTPILIEWHKGYSIKGMTHYRYITLPKIGE